ncbi:MAG: hypothetical protein H6559_21620 [Lewinellaceae bacterium]|nr:hypothetical protein [Lewinellaceae bacterium]
MAYPQMQSAYNATRQRLEAVEDRLELLVSENAHLREELEGLKNKVLYAAAAPTAVPPREEPPAVPRSLHPEPGLPDASVVEEEPVVITNPDKPFLQDKIGAAAEVPEKDDLTLIDGIGPFLEKKLNEIGVFTYDEISSWDTARTREVTHAIQYFEGRIERDKWVEQAARLVPLKKHENPEAFKGRYDALSNDPEDLKVVEGIGTKIEELLKTAGINNWKALANADAGLLRDILEAAGTDLPHPRPLDLVRTGRLAANGEWGVLKEYHTELHGGESRIGSSGLVD